MRTALRVASTGLAGLFVSAQTSAFQGDTLRCIPTHGRPIYLARVYEQLVPRVGLAFDRRVGDPSHRIEELDPGRTLTLLARRRLEVYLPDFDPLALTVEVKQGTAADPVHAHLTGLARLLAQPELGGTAALGALEETPAGVSGDARGEDPALRTALGEVGLGDTLRVWLAKQLPLEPRGCERIQRALGLLKDHGSQLQRTLEKVKALEASLRRELAERRPLEEGATAEERTQDGEARARLDRRIQGALQAQVRIQGRLEALPSLRDRLLPFSQPEQWKGGDLLLGLTTQTPATVVTWTVTLKHLDEPSAPAAERTFAVRYGYLWERAAFDLSAATVYHRPGQALERLALQAGSQKEALGQKTVDVTAALCANLALRIPRSWVHPLVQVGVGKGTQDVVLMAGVGLRFSEPLPISLSYGVTRGKDGNGTYWAVGYRFY